MKKTLFTGAGVALVTPMNADGSINYPVLEQLIDFQIENGTDAIIACGTTGESATMTTQEHIDVLEFIIKKTAKRVPVIAGTGSNETTVATELSVHAEKCGADGLLIVTPYYNKASQHGLVKHYFHIADRVNIPIITYNVPSRTGCNIKPETNLELSKHQNIVAVKEASGDISQVARIRELCGDDLDIYSGNDDQIVPVMSLGGKGVISVLSNVMPKLAHDIAAKYLEGDVKESAKLQIEYLDLINGLFMDVNPIPVKEAMNLMGYNVGECRLPLCNMLPAQVENLKKIMAKHGLLK